MSWRGRIRSSTALLLGVQILAAGAGHALQDGAEVREPSVDSLEAFEILQYVAVRVQAPGDVIAMDNNARILFACLEGRSPADLRESGIAFADSQIEFLIATNLLFRDGLGDLYTAFPVLDEAETTALRAEATAHAEVLSQGLQAQVEALSAALESSGHRAHARPILFSYVLDGMVWGFLEEYRKVPPRRISIRNPFWSGTVWAVRPERESRLRTRSISVDGLTLKIMSTADPVAVDELFSNAGLLREALGRANAAQAVEQGPGRELLARFGLVGDDGRWTVPVIDEVNKDPVFRAAETLTSDLVDALLETVDLDDLEDRYGFRGSSQTLVAVYHELMMELVLRLEEPERGATFEGLRDAAFLVDRRFPKADGAQDPGPARDVIETGRPEEDG